ncbi:MAG: formate/nitrite transporter family protein [Pseudomonadota bacterium]
MAVEDDDEARSVDKASTLPSRLVYEVIRRDGEEELARPVPSLIWSGIAAGLMISFSVLGEAIFRTYLPDAPWRYLIENLGYSFGFLIVILGRMQLFTENTITTVLPFLARPCVEILLGVLRLWAIVLAANIVGAFGAAALFAYTAAIPAELLPAIGDLSRHATGMGASESFVRGIPAGILVASIVWTMPQAREASVVIILLFTWLIAAGDFTHVIAGSVEMAYLLLIGELGGIDAIAGFFLPVLAGNVVGGTAIFAFMAWGQVRAEVENGEG